MLPPCSLAAALPQTGQNSTQGQADERLLQLLRLLNRLLERHPEARRRGLAWHTPAVVPVWPQARSHAQGGGEEGTVSPVGHDSLLLLLLHVVRLFFVTISCLYSLSTTSTALHTHTLSLSAYDCSLFLPACPPSPTPPLLHCTAPSLQTCSLICPAAPACQLTPLWPVCFRYGWWRTSPPTSPMARHTTSTVPATAVSQTCPSCCSSAAWLHQRGRTHR